MNSILRQAIRCIDVLLGIIQFTKMNHPSNKPSSPRAAQGFHARGREDYAKGRDVEELRAREKKLRQRIVSFCRPKGFLGHFALAYGKWRLVWKLRARFDGRDAMFLRKGTTNGFGRLAVVGKP